MISRRLDTTALQCYATAACPAIFELDDGDFAVIGAEVTEGMKPHLPKGSGCADYERIVRLPRATFEDAVRNL